MMKILMLVLFSAFVAQTISAQTLTPKQILLANRDAVVLIGANGQFSGNGFLVSQDGFVVTANHVVSTQESGYSAYYQRIDIFRRGVPGAVTATPIARSLEKDVAILKIDGTNLPHVSMASFDEIDIGDQITIVTGFIGIPDMFMLVGTVSIKTQSAIGPGHPPFNSVLFQAPIRKGFSGAPLFSRKGHVVGIVNTRVFGISPALDTMRQQIIASKNNPNVQTTIRFQGIDAGAAILELTNVLDQTIISDLGTAVSAEYAKELKDQITREKK